jgi:preprotein translocase subunit SecE
MKLIEYLKEIKAETKHVKWPTNRHAWIMTVLVIIFSLFIAAYLGAFDWIFTGILENVV